MKLFTKQKQSHKCREQTYDYKGGEEWRGMNWETGINIHTLPYMKQIRIYYCTWNSSQCSVMRCIRKEFFKRVDNMYMFKKRRKTQTYNKERNT